MLDGESRNVLPFLLYHYKSVLAVMNYFICPCYS